MEEKSPFDAPEEKNPYNTPTLGSSRPDPMAPKSDIATPMGLLSICVALIGFGWICCCGFMIIPTSAAAVICGVIALQHAEPENQAAKILAILGIVLGVLELLGFAGLFIFQIAASM